MSGPDFFSAYLEPLKVSTRILFSIGTQTHRKKTPAGVYKPGSQTRRQGQCGDIEYARKKSNYTGSPCDV